MIDARAPLDRWRALVDSLTYGTLLALWETRSPLAASLPRSALPRTTLGLARFIQAEQLVAAARWEGAYAAYLLAEETDSTCLLCSWRVNDVARWLGRQPDPARTRRYLAHIAAFPADYQSLIRAGQLPLVERLDTLHALTERSGRFLLGWFQLGDELFHRGPLAGRRRGEAIPAFEKAARLRPDFRPAWEHLAWVSIAEGDSIGADRALAALDRRGPVQDAYSQTLRLLMHLGFAWRFVPESRAVAITHEVLQDSAARVSADLGAGPRLLPSFDAPRGAVAFGRLLEEDGSRDLERSGLIAEVLGWVALGDPDRARERARRLVNLSAEPEVALFAAELDASLALLEGATPGPDALRALRTWTTAGAAPEPIRRRAAWMSTLLRRRTAPAPLAGERTGAPPAVGQVGPFAVFLQADSIASAGNPGAAIARMRAVDVDEAALRGDPFYRTVARLALAEWRARLGDVEGARGEMLWHEHTFVGPLPTGLPQAAEIDWAFGTLARWRLARLLDRDNASRLHLDEACRAYGAVARHWGQAGGSYGAWAATARDRLNALRCDDAGL
jgi:hypothetical protein